MQGSRPKTSPTRRRRQTHHPDKDAENDGFDMRFAASYTKVAKARPPFVFSKKRGHPLLGRTVVQLRGYWFKSDLFHPVLGEDAETNPGVFGKELAQWMAHQLQAYGYRAPEVIPEDWGWCVVCAREPFLLWVGCGNMTEEDVPEKAGYPSPAHEPTWRCFPVAEVPFWKRVFRRADVEQALAKLQTELKSVLAAEPKVRLVEEP